MAIPTPAPGLLDLVCMSVSGTPGTGTITLGSVYKSGPAGGGVLSITDAGAVTNGWYSYAITDGNNRELAYGQYSSGTLTRNTRIASVNGTMQVTPISATSSAIISSIAAMEDLVTAANVAQFLGGSVNKFRNPGFDIAQRGTSGDFAPGTLNYCLDGWIIGSTGGALNWTQFQDGGVFAGNALRVEGWTSQTGQTLAQRIESLVAQQMLLPGGGLQAITVQFTIFNSIGATLTPTLTTSYPTSADNFGTLTTDLSAVSLQSIPNNTTAVVAYTFVPASLSNGYQVQLNFPAMGSSSDSIAVSRADIRATPYSMPGLNSNPPPPEIRPVGLEMANCLRYLQVWGGMVGVGQCDGANTGYLVLSYSPMRATPALSVPAAGDINIETPPITFGAASAAFSSVTNQSCLLAVGLSGNGVAGQAFVAYLTGGPLMIATAEV